MVLLEELNKINELINKLKKDNEEYKKINDELYKDNEEYEEANDELQKDNEECYEKCMGWVKKRCGEYEEVYKKHVEIIKELKNKLNKRKIFKKSKKFQIIFETSTIIKLKEENNILLNKFEIVNEKLNEKTILNKRLINILTTYRYNELNTIEKYNYEEIKQKNKKLNNEFLKIAKLMKL